MNENMSKKTLPY